MAAKGRPSAYTPELAERICNLIATTSRGLAFIVSTNPGLPSTVTIHAWLADETKADFLRRYLRARERQADLIFDECLEIADDASGDAPGKRKGDHEDVHATEQVARSKLRVDTRMRMAGKLAPKKYGEKLVLGGDEDNPLTVQTLTARDRAKAMAALIAKQWSPS